MALCRSEIRKQGKRACLCLAVAMLLLPALGAGSARATVVPTGFADELVTEAESPTALAFTPNGRMLVTSQTGALRVYEDGALLADPALDLGGKICADDERGLLGVAVDPSFATNHYIYLYYTFQKVPGNCDTNDAATPAGPDFPVNRVSRFVLKGNNTVDPASESVLIDNIPSPHGNHNGGDLQFGKDGYLYVSVGDGGCDYAGDSGCASGNNASRDPNVLLGKVLRVSVPDGGIPPSNPHTGPNSGRCNASGRTDPGKFCREAYASGLRNPWRLGFDPNAAGTRFFINDVGEGRWEEIDRGRAGADYGWNIREGPCAAGSTTDCGPPPAGMTNPIYSYGHSAGCDAITAAGFVPRGLWPPQYDHAYLFGDLTCGRIWTLTPDGSGGYAATEFASGIGMLIGGRFGPNGTTRSYYYISWDPPSLAEIRRITYVASANRPPNASATADPTSGNVPLTVDFDASASGDPDGDPLTFDWDFGDGSSHATTAIASHTYTSVGTHTAVLTVRDDRGGSDQESFQISAGNNPPVPRIQSPGPANLFKVGEQITLRGSASDPEDGPLPAGSLSWQVLRHHDTHTHPLLPPTSGNNVKISAPAPEDLAAATNSYLEIYLTATDSDGLSTRIERNVYPHTVDLSFETEPSGLRLTLAGTTIVAPRTVTSWEGWGLSVDAPDQADGAGVLWQFAGWSDGGERSHSIITPASAASYVASFEASPAVPSPFSFSPPPPAFGTVPRPVSVVERRVKSKRRCVVPKLRGLRLSQAKRKLRRARCRYRVRGAGRVVSTSPRRGTRTRKTVLVRASRKR